MADEKRLGVLSELPSYTNHYNATLNRCFIEIWETNSIKSNSTTETVTDVLESRIYASYLWVNAQGKKYWDVKPTTCEVQLPSGEKKTCASVDEFDELISVYMDH